MPPAPLLCIFPRLLVKTRLCVCVKSEAFGWVPWGGKAQSWPPGGFPAVRIVVKSRPQAQSLEFGSSCVLDEPVTSPGSLSLFFGQ